jgi:hypothetical protein
MSSRVKKTLLLLLAITFLFGAGRVQHSLNGDRDALGLTRGAVLDNAPPVLAFTTVALGGFRGLISNFLWMRANDLQQDDKFFEAAQLADWITKLEPTFASVWVFQGWNMAYNISVKFKENAPGDYSDRWRWVRNGIELMRDGGLRYNPNSVDLYRELAWQFQHKMGANLDDANMFYKREWAAEMKPFFGVNGTNYSNLLSPAPATEDWTNAATLKEKYKLDPEFIKSVDDKYGPFDWRLPEAHAIYWGAKGKEQARLHPDKVNPDDIIKLERIIYQSIQQAFKHGKVSFNPFTKQYSLGPNLDLINNASDYYLEAAKEDEKNRDHIERAHRNFLRDAIYALYESARTVEAEKWFKYLGEKYPDKAILENDPNSLPKTLTLDEYAVAVAQIDAGETSQERVTWLVQGMMVRAYLSLVQDKDDSYQNLKNLTLRLYQVYNKKTSGSNGPNRIPLPPYDELNKQVVAGLLDSERGLPPEARAILRTRLGLPAESSKPAAPAAANLPMTNSAVIVPTNAPASQ